MTAHIAYPEELLDDKKLNEFYDNVSYNHNHRERWWRTYITRRIQKRENGGFQLEINDEDYYTSVLNLTRFGTDFSFSKLRQPVNKSDWITHSRTAIVNAFYSAIENSIRESS